MGKSSSSESKPTSGLLPGHMHCDEVVRGYRANILKNQTTGVEPAEFLDAGVKFGLARTIDKERRVQNHEIGKLTMDLGLEGKRSEPAYDCVGVPFPFVMDQLLCEPAELNSLEVRSVGRAGGNDVPELADLRMLVGNLPEEPFLVPVHLELEIDTIPDVLEMAA
jgi:hypothetical protein